MTAEPAGPSRLTRSPPRLSGRSEPEIDALTIALISQPQRRRRATAGTSLGRIRALASDPHLNERTGRGCDGRQPTRPRCGWAATALPRLVLGPVRQLHPRVRVCICYFPSAAGSRGVAWRP